MVCRSASGEDRDGELVRSTGSTKDNARQARIRHRGRYDATDETLQRILLFSLRCTNIDACTGDDGWQQVTRKEKRKKSKRSSAERKGGPMEEDQQPSCVSCLTGDFGIQNVLLQMGLKLLTPEGVRIRHLSTFGLKCASCFKVIRRVRSSSPAMTSRMTTIPCLADGLCFLPQLRKRHALQSASGDRCEWNGCDRGSFKTATEKSRTMLHPTTKGTNSESYNLVSFVV